MSLISTQSTTLHLGISHTRILPSIDPLMNRFSQAGLNWTQVTAKVNFNKEIVSSNSEVKLQTYEEVRDIGLPKLLCGKTVTQFADPSSHKRTVLSVDADNRCCKVANFNLQKEKDKRKIAIRPNK